MRFNNALSTNSNDSVLIVQKLPDFVVIGSDHALHGDSAGGVSFDCDATVDDQNSAGKLGGEARLQKMHFEVGKLGLVHENWLVA